MPYFLIQNFSQGLDARMSPATLPPGALRYANNVHVTRGGELQKRKAFVPHITLPPGSVGLASERDSLLVFGNGAQALPAGVKWVNVGGVPERLMDSTRWRTSHVSSILMADGTRKIFHGDVEAVWTFMVDETAGIAATKPGPLRTYKSTVYAGESGNFFTCELHNPSAWGPGYLGSEVVDIGQESEFMAKMNAISVFQGTLVLFSEDGIQVWEVDPDPNLNVLKASLSNTGCLSPRTVLNFGNFDVVFLAKSGIRSLKARQATDIMNVEDIGTPVDDFVSQLISTVTPDAVRFKAFSVVEPESSRLWVSLGDIIMVHSYYNGSDISAWSTYTPGFTVDGMAVLGPDTFIRSGDTIYRYGGVDRLTYDTCKAEVWTPFHHAEKPATQKAFTGFDVGCEGQWLVKVAADPTRTDVVETVGTVTNTTFNEPNQAMSAWTTHLSLVLECTDAKASTLTNLAMHYTEGAAA